MWSETLLEKWAIICIVLQRFTTGRPVSGTSNGDECARRTEQSCPAALVTPINAHSTLGSSKQRLFSISTGKGQETGVVLEAPAPWDAEGVERAGALEACWAA